VEVGWQPDEHGQTEYIIQLQPHQLKNLKPGDTIDVGVRPQLRNISSFQIVIGDNQLPRIGTTPKLSVASPNEQILQADHEQSVTARRYPDASNRTSNSGQGQPADDGFTTPANQIETEGTLQWNRDPAAVDWPAQATSGSDNRSVLTRDVTPQPNTQPNTQPNASTFNNDANSRPRLDGRAPLTITKQPDGDSQPVDDGRRRLIDIGSQIPLRQDRSEDHPVNTERFPQAVIDTPDNNKPFNRFDSNRSQPFGEAPQLGLPNPDVRPSQPNNDALGPRYAQPEPTLDRLPADYRDARLTAGDVPMSDMTDNSQSLEQLRREMARNLERRATVQPQTGPANFGVQPGGPRYAKDPNPRVAATVPTYPQTQNTATTVAVTPTPTFPFASNRLTTNPVATQPITANPASTGSNAMLPRTNFGTTSEAAATTVARPWLPLMLSLLALCASLGGNLYLGWMTLDLRRRFRHFALGLRFHEDDRRSMASSSI
ncbi:MAG TPA: hypothetical protein VMX74_03590, partial [Pirellulales bacterium]|nr:hypothetical protein [Pirellulales bacterium]